MISTLRWVRKITFLFFFGFAPKFSTRFFASQHAKSTWGVRRQQHFFVGSRPNKSFLHVFGRGGRGIRRGREMYTKRFCAAKRAYPLQNADFLRIKKTKKNTITISTSITDQASHASRQPRTNSTPTPAPTDDRQLAVRYRYWDGLEVPHIVSLREPLDLALIRNAAALGATQQGDADTGLVLACHNISSRERARERASSFRASFECIDDDDGGPSSPSSRCLGDETTPSSA